MKIILTVCLLALLTSSAAPAGEGPLQVRNQFPLFLGIDQPFLEDARVRDAIVLSVNHSSVYITRSTPEWKIGLDLEMTEMDLRLKKTFGDRTEGGINVPFLRPSKGFFDQPLETWHAFLGTSDYGRSERPHNEFLYEVDYRGKPVIRGENDRAAIGDVQLSLKRLLVQGPDPVSLLVNAELPTGNARMGYGNGSIDFAVSLSANRRWGTVYRGYCAVGYVRPGDLRAYQTIPLRDFGYAGAAVEAAWWERISVLVQALVEQSPYPRTGTFKVDSPALLFTAGARYRRATGDIELSLTEDASVSGSPDFTANAAWIRTF